MTPPCRPCALAFFQLLVALFCLAATGMVWAEPAGEWCSELPRPANAALEPGPVTDPWFQIYPAAPGVYALAEPWQFQEVISYLILGERRALLFDSGLGLAPIRPLVERLTALPVTVLNSHTHFDHVGGNAEFDSVLALDIPYTRANMAGFAHEELAGEVADGAFCRPPPADTDLGGFRTRAWKATDFVDDGTAIDLGGRVLEVLRVPGHTPDALALLDRANGLLWTGDTWYDGPLWLFVPETSLDDYQASLDRLIGLAPGLRQLLPAHNTARADPGRMAATAAALVKIRAGEVAGEADGAVLEFTVDGVTIVTAQPVLDGQQADLAKGGSGLTGWD